MALLLAAHRTGLRLGQVPIDTLREETSYMPRGAFVSNLSSTGAFVRLETLPARGRVVELDLAFPEDVVHETVNAFVVHVAPGRGIGVQFIGASEAFKSRLECYLAQLSR